MSQKINNRLIFEHFFTPSGENEFICICGKTRRQNVKNGYTILINHVFTSHLNYKEVIQTKIENSCIVNSFLPTKKAKKNSWLKWVIGKGLPFDIVEDKMTTEIVNLDPISRGSLVNYIEKLTVEVENEIKKILPSKFGVMLDGWTDNGTSTRYIAVFACFPDKKTKQATFPLLIFNF